MKKKILLVESSVNIGGSAICLINLLKYLDQSKYDLSVLLFSKNECTEKIKKYCNNINILEPIHPIKGKTKTKIINIINLSLIRLRHFFSFLRIIHKVDLVHLNNGFYYPAIVAARLLGKPCICHFRSLPADHKTGNNQIPFMSRFFGKLSNYNIAISEAVRKEYIRLGFNVNKIIVIPDGVDLMQFQNTAHQKSINTNNTNKEFVIGTIARLVPEKGINTLINAMPYILDKIKNLRCIVIGDGPLIGDLKNQVAALKLKEKFTFTGNLNNPYEILSNFDVFILPSLREGLSLSIMEAMASGIPVVATRVGGIVELIENGINGILVDPENPKSVANAVLALLNNIKLNKQISVNALTKAKNEFSIVSSIRKIERKYNELLNE